MGGTALADPLVGSMLGKDYRVLEQIGIGGMAVVYEVEHQTLLKRFAAKVLSPEQASSAEARARFMQEAHAASQLDHENIVSISDFGVTADQRPYFVMELLRGKTLAARLDEGPMTLEEVVAVSVPVARALAHAHAEGVIHRDIKPENIFLVQRSQGRWSVKMLDFGIAKLPVNDRMTKTGQALGSPAFMSPEACKGDDVDQRADVYSFGILLYLMLAGRVPFDDANLLKVLQMQVSSPLPLPTSFNPDLPPSIEAVIIRALAKDPDDRYPTMDAMLLDFEAALPNGADLMLLQAQFGVAQTPFPGSLERVRNSGLFPAATTGQHPSVTGQHVTTGRLRVHPDTPAPVALPSAPSRGSGGKLALAGLLVLLLGGAGAGAYVYLRRDAAPVATAPVATAPVATAPVATAPVATAPVEAPVAAKPVEVASPSRAGTEPAIADTDVPASPDGSTDNTDNTGDTDDTDNTDNTDNTDDTDDTAPSSRQPTKRVATVTRPARPARPAAKPAPSKPAPSKPAPSKPALSKPAPSKPAPSKPAVATTAVGSAAPTAVGSAASTAVGSAASATVGSAASTKPPEAPAVAASKVPPPSSPTASQPATSPTPATQVAGATPAPTNPVGPAAVPKPVGSLDATPSIVTLDVSGSLPTSVVQRGVERVLPALRDCYRTAAKAQQATTPVTLSMSFEVDESSSARNVSAKTVFGSLASCAKGAVARVQTRQAPDVGTVHVVLAVKFTPI